MKCGVCGRRWVLSDEYLVWQPLGPDKDVRKAFYEPKSYWKHHPQIIACYGCKLRIEKGANVRFKHQGDLYSLEGDTVTRIPRKY